MIRFRGSQKFSTQGEKCSNFSGESFKASLWWACHLTANRWIYTCPCFSPSRLQFSLHWFFRYSIWIIFFSSIPLFWVSFSPYIVLVVNVKLISFIPNVIILDQSNHGICNTILEIFSAQNNRRCWHFTWAQYRSNDQERLIFKVSLKFRFVLQSTNLIWALYRLVFRLWYCETSVKQ